MQGRRLIIFGLTGIAFFAGIGSVASKPQEMPKEYAEILAFLGKSGDYQENVLKVNIPRNDLTVTVQGVPTPTAFGFGGWVAMSKGDGGREVMMGDLVLLQEEVNPAMSALLDSGLEVTALHNHFFWEEPRIFYMHIYGNGQAVDLARRLKPALDLIGRATSPGAAGKRELNQGAASTQGSLNPARIAQIVGHAGQQTGPVYKITVGRNDFSMEHGGATVNARMGLNTWAAFLGSDADAVVAGDVAMLEHEVPAVLKALRKHGLDVVAIHHHMTGTRPVVIFLHYWGRGPAEKLALGFRTSLDELGKRPAPEH